MVHIPIQVIIMCDTPFHTTLHISSNQIITSRIKGKQNVMGKIGLTSCSKIKLDNLLPMHKVSLEWSCLSRCIICRKHIVDETNPSRERIQWFFVLGNLFSNDSIASDVPQKNHSYTKCINRKDYNMNRRQGSDKTFCWCRPLKRNKKEREDSRKRGSRFNDLWHGSRSLRVTLYGQKNMKEEEVVCECQERAKTNERTLFHLIHFPFEHLFSLFVMSRFLWMILHVM